MNEAIPEEPLIDPLVNSGQEGDSSELGYDSEMSFSVSHSSDLSDEEASPRPHHTMTAGYDLEDESGDEEGVRDFD